MHPLLEKIKDTPAGRRADNKHLFPDDVQEKKRQKYNNDLIEFDGKFFRSKKELGRYIELRALETAGEISDLKLQVPFELNHGGTHSFRYICDFLYKDKTGQIIVEDAKGAKTKTFLKKAKLLEKEFGIKVKIS